MDSATKKAEEANNPLNKSNFYFPCLYYEKEMQYVDFSTSDLPVRIEQFQVSFKTPKSSAGHAKFTFVNNDEKFSLRVQFFFSQLPKKVIFFLDFFCQMIPLDTWNAILTALPKMICSESEKL